MSLLTQCQRVVDECGMGARPSTIVGSIQALPRQLLALAQREVEILKEMSWQALTREQTLTTVANQEGYAFPSDYARYVTDTCWDATNYWQMKGSLNPAEWQAWKRGMVATPIRRRFRVRRNQFLVFPTPTVSGDSLVIEYQSTLAVLAADGTTYRTNYEADTDTTVFPEELIGLGVKWRLKREKGLDYTEDYNDYQAEVSSRMATDTPAYTLDMTGLRPLSTFTFPGNIPENVTGV